MLNKKLLVSAASAVLLASCGGGSDESTSQDIIENVDRENQMVETCLQATTLNISGVKIPVATYDENGDGCLNPAEIETAVAAEKVILAEIAAEIATRTVDAVVVNEQVTFPQVKSFTMTGNAPVGESSADVAELHTNMLEGLYSFEFEIENVTADYSDKKLIIYFNDTPVSSLIDEGGSLGNHISLSPQNASYRFICEYQTDFQHSCMLVGPDQTVIIDDSDKYIGNPVETSLHIMICTQGKVSLDCHKNYASLNVRLN
ncbi:MAG: hypothetical protein HRU20_30390 [Pseudomonadales bacterium]|nr:hypothetical protein [Pseudomonadales bacterium]